MFKHAPVAELADAYDSGSYGATRAGSSPVWCTTLLGSPKIGLLFFINTFHLFTKTNCISV